jgi:hypothetical protein
MSRWFAGEVVRTPCAPTGTKTTSTHLPLVHIDVSVKWHLHIVMHVDRDRDPVDDLERGFKSFVVGGDDDDQMDVGRGSLVSLCCRQKQT